MMIRSFIAIDFPDETRKALEDIQKELKQCGAGVRWVKPSSIHLTLKFLGNIQAALVEEIALAVAQEIRDQPPITLRPAGLGAFPSRRKPRVIWIGMEGEVQRLNGIQARVENALEPLGFVREKRDFRPHLTIGRVKDRRRLQSLVDAMATLDMEPFNSFDADEIILYKSDLRPTGAIYTKLHRMPLAAPASP
ncbi:MAG: RNA 2',3'-cyclic phosphodiesterase [Deltaproteobacteria bacterium]|nr:MAG: RNA 2',3'-cyclic phosphodiesterase [Deltaproteobacteria bacterium]